MRTPTKRTLFGVATGLLVACGVGATSSPTVPIASTLGDFRVTGDPAGATGATWTLTGTSNGIVYDLSGILFKPAGTGPFPAVVISHGAGGNANSRTARAAPARPC